MLLESAREQDGPGSATRESRLDAACLEKGLQEERFTDLDLMGASVEELPTAASASTDAVVTSVEPERAVEISSPGPDGGHSWGED